MCFLLILGRLYHDHKKKSNISSIFVFTKNMRSYIINLQNKRLARFHLEHGLIGGIIMTQTRPHVTFDSRMYKRRPKRRRLVIVNKTRFVLATMIALILLSILFSYMTGTIMSVASTDQSYLEFTVTSGDTLWEIASDHNYYNEDVRQVVYNIKKLNQMNTSDIYPGQVLIIPVTR